MNLIALFCGLAASIIFMLDSTRLAGRIISLLNHFKKHIGVFNGEPSADVLIDLNNEVRKSRSRNIIGYSLFGISFTLQLIVLLQTAS